MRGSSRYGWASAVVANVLGWTGVGVATAQTSSDQQLSPVQVEGRRDVSTIKLDEPSSTATRLGVSIRETPASVEVIDQETIRERGKRTVMEALEGGTGLTIGTPGGSPGTVTARGFEGNSVRFLYDGIPLIDAGMVTRPNGTFNIDRVEVLRGPASVLHGIQGVGAAVNYISRGPSRVREPIDVEAGLGNYRSWRLGAGTGGPVGGAGLYYRFDASTTRFDSFQIGNRHEYDRLTGSIAYDLAPRMTVSLHVDWLRDEQEDSYWGTPLNNGRIDPALRKTNYNNLTDNIFKGRPPGSVPCSTGNRATRGSCATTSTTTTPSGTGATWRITPITQGRARSRVRASAISTTITG
jgi:iron complex outermembrane receptor protein